LSRKPALQIFHANWVHFGCVDVGHRERRLLALPRELEQKTGLADACLPAQMDERATRVVERRVECSEISFTSDEPACPFLSQQLSKSG